MRNPIKRAYTFIVYIAVILGFLSHGHLLHAQELVPVPYSALKGWKDDNHKEAFGVFQHSCAVFVKNSASQKLRANADKHARIAICNKARHQQSEIINSQDAARRFFEQYFQPYTVKNEQSAPFFTGYFEPEVFGSRQKTASHHTPLLQLPENHSSKSVFSHELGIQLTASRRSTSGKNIPYPNRKDIETGALGKDALPLVWLDPVDAFFIHIQGSARIRFDDGHSMRVAFAGRNGYPYTAIGQILMQKGILEREEITAERLKQWLRAHPQDAAHIMHQNASYIFFQKDVTLKQNEGPRGAAGLSLHAKRSLAIDPKYWPYGLPIWVDINLPIQPHSTLRRLMIAQDTGAAIKGMTRSDIYWGTGEEAGIEAGKIKHTGQFVVLFPKVGKP